jgi:ABC-type Mn2+/Zn2+ transport system permease subunit
MLDPLLDPWSHAFLQRALLELVLLGVVGGVLGCWIILYELAYSAESLAHALFPGLVAAALLGLPLLAGGAAGVAVAAVAIALAARVPSIGRDAAVGIVITSLFGLGVLLALSPASPRGLSTLLFGDLLGVSAGDLVAAAALGGAVLGALAFLHRPLVAVGFDRATAGALGVRATALELALLGLVAVAVVVGVQALGNLLVVAIVVAPAATARLLTRRLLPMMVVAALVAVVCGVGGLYLSYYADTAGGASVAAVLVGVYAVVLLTRRGFAALASLAMPASGRGLHARVRLK